MNGIAVFDIFLRGGAIAVLAVIAIAFVFGTSTRRKSLSVAALSLGIAAYLTVSSPNLPICGGWASAPLIAVAGTAPILVYWAGMELFVDRFQLRWWHAAIALAIALGAWFHRFLPAGAQMRGVLVILIYIHLLYTVVSTATDDLVESRRRFRSWFLGLMALLGGAIGIIELFDFDQDLPPLIFPLHAAAFLMLAIVFIAWAFHIRGDIWVTSVPRNSPKTNDLSPADSAVLARLNEAMEKDIWRQENLTVGQLAHHLNTPEHRLRRVINRGLGYRNFAAFINESRIFAAKATLSDLKCADKPILTIAHDVGFASLGPFNRAFREATGESPTDYRRRYNGPANRF